MRQLVRNFTLAVCAMMLLAAGPPAQSQRRADPHEAIRPADVVTWPTLGTTVRMDPATGSTPRQFRHVQIAPADFEAFVRTRAFRDGTTFAVSFYGATLDASHTPNLYHAGREQAFAMEIIDRAHPDGRRFYVFAAGATHAAPLPPGNECAVCHAAQGSFHGTFAHMYPAMAPYLAQAP